MGCRYVRFPKTTERELSRLAGSSQEQMDWMDADDAERRKLGLESRFDVPIESRRIWMCGPAMQDEVFCRAGSLCGALGTHQCDYPIGEGKTCDLAICEEHKCSIGLDLDLCPIHAAQWQADTGEVGVRVLDLNQPSAKT